MSNPLLATINLTPEERVVFDKFVSVHTEAKGEVSEAEAFHLTSAALEYIKYMRQTRDEFKSGQLASQSKHHPLIQMRAELDAFYGKEPQKKAKGNNDDISAFFDRGPSDHSMPKLKIVS